MLNKLNCIIVEDEPLALKKASNFVNQCTSLELTSTFTNPIEALEFLKNQSVDLILLDVQMEGINGVDFIGHLSYKPQIILTTAYSEYALVGYDLAVTDYLLKPYTFPRFKQAVDKAAENLSNKDSILDSSSILIKTEHRLENVQLKDILYIEGMRDYRRFHLTDKRIMTLETFSSFEQKLPKQIVCRVHKSYMVGLSHIESIERKRIKIGETRIPISETYEKEFMQLLHSH
jgi:DNA-binding LytR/AlgR family response regulator